MPVGVYRTPTFSTNQSCNSHRLTTNRQNPLALRQWVSRWDGIASDAGSTKDVVDTALPVPIPAQIIVYTMVCNGTPSGVPRTPGTPYGSLPVLPVLWSSVPVFSHWPDILASK